MTPAGAAASVRAYSTIDPGWKRFNLTAFAFQSLIWDLRRGFGKGTGVLYDRMLARHKCSPIVVDVGDADQFSVAAGLTYTF